ncbi:MAG: HAMP domain-containing histidine kinase [Firmicutes bacterium]|nr:HAMP domain-containing histidine kinase [Bacillota bacterium]
MSKGWKVRENKRSRWYRNAILYFVLAGFIVTCNFLLFFHFAPMSLQESKSAAMMTLGNVLFMAILFSLADILRRYLTFTRPLRRIQEGIDKVVSGDFTTRIQPLKGPGASIYNPVIEGLNKMTADLGSVETLRTDFISNVSHELKTPLAAIQNNSTLLQDPQITEEERQRYAKAITAQTSRLSLLISNILKLNKLENQQIFPAFASVDLTESVCSSMISFEHAWEEKEIEIHTSFDDTLQVSADPDMLSIVWNNLMSNAVKFTPEKGTITIETLRKPGRPAVRIKDTGCGMDEETQKNIFRKFYQGDTSHAAEGNGLGLALVRRICEIHGCEITVNSRVGAGTEFIIAFPEQN